MKFSKNFKFNKVSLAIGLQLFLCFWTSGQKIYLPSEESLKERRTPEWFGNAKLGIFIHWGLYSVPGWAKPDFSVDQVTDWKLPVPGKYEGCTNYVKGEKAWSEI